MRGDSVTTKFRRNILCNALIVALAASVAMTSAYAQEQVKSFDVPMQPAASGLNAFAEQADITLVFSQDLVVGVNTKSLRGSYSVTEGLDRMLEGTRLSYRLISENTVAISSSSSDTAPAVNDQEELTSSVPIDSEVTEMDRIIVTGTHIGGSTPVGANLQIYTREDIERTGAGSLSDFARQMPGNLSNIDSIANSASNSADSFGTAPNLNAYNGASFNLRGLGPSATLTLLNGRRIAAGGADGAFIDISAIPLSAIERVDVLTDGASAIYGADAIGGVVNIITRREYEGAETQLRYGVSTEGGAESVVGSQSLGRSWGSGSVLLSYDYTRNGGLDASRRDYIPDLGGGPYLLVPEDKRDSILLSGKQQLTASTTLSGTAIHSERDFSMSASTASSFGTSSNFTDGDSRQSGATVGIDHAFGSDWNLALTAGYSKLEQQSDSITYTNGVNTFSNSISADTTELNMDALMNWNVLSLPAGFVKAALGAGYRREGFGATAAVMTQPVEREVSSVFGELLIPLIGDPNALSFIKRLDLSAALRHDRYDDFGSSTNPRFGLRWTLAEGVDLRASYGTSFRAPQLSQSRTATYYYVAALPNATAPGGVTSTLILVGANPNLKPEEASSYTVGLDLQPSSVPSLSFSIDYFNIDFNSRISTLPQAIASTALTNPAAAPFVNLQPSLTEVQAAFDDPGFLFDIPNTGPTGVGAIFDQRAQNMAATTESGVDFRVAYAFTTKLGEISLNTVFNRILKYDFQPVAGVPSLSLVNTFGQPTKWRSNSSVGWARDRTNAVLTINYVGSYENTVAVQRPGIDSWTTANLYLSYQAPESAANKLLRGLTLALTINNLTDEKPPYVLVQPPYVLPGENGIPFDPVNASPVGRFIALSVRKSW